MKEKILNQTSSQKFKEDTFQLLRGLILGNMCSIEGDDLILNFLNNQGSNVPDDVREELLESFWYSPSKLIEK